MKDVAETLTSTVRESHAAIDEIAESARVLLRAQTSIDRRIALEKLDAARGRLDARVAKLRGELVSVYARERDDEDERETEPPPRRSA